MFGRTKQHLFETFRIEDGQVRLLDLHIDRAAQSGVSRRDIASFKRLTQSFCALNRPGTNPHILRIDFGVGCVTATPRQLTNDAHLHLVTVEGFDPQNRSRQIKAADRTWCEQASRAVEPAQPLLVSPSGNVGETTTANFFVIDHSGTILTSPANGLLPGVTRRWLLSSSEFASRVSETPLTVEALDNCVAAFTTNAAYGVKAVDTLNQRILAHHPTVDALAAEWNDLIN